MTKQVLIQEAEPSTLPPSSAQGCGERSLGVIAAAVAPRTGRAPSVPNPAPLERSLETSREQLRAALMRLDALETQSLLLRHQVALQQRALLRARRSAYHDELTGLPNRRLLLDRYQQALALAARQPRFVALLFLDLDGFKAVNDNHGHAVGDRILRQVAARLRSCVRASDTACRYGGDEFVVLLPELESRRSAFAAARKIRARLAAPYDVDGIGIAVRASVGIAIYPADGEACEDLVRAADASMYLQKFGVGGRAPRVGSA